MGRSARRAPAASTIGALVACCLVIGGCGMANAPRSSPPRHVAVSAAPPDRAPGASATRASGACPCARRASSATRHADGPFAVGERVLALVDHSRTIPVPGVGRRPRPLTTVVRYPALGPASRVDARRATPDVAAGPFPLIVFGHGFAVTPATYFRLLRAWAAAGFVVAAPVFPLENAHAPGGPDEGDLVNQPRDMRFVISSLLGSDGVSRGWLKGLIAAREIAVAGQSDGGETALAVAYDRAYADRRIGAAIILSGARLPEAGPSSLIAGGPPMLAVQGTADTINLPVNTDRFFTAAGRPKFLLELLGAAHLPPYTDQQPQLSIVERSSIAFLQGYLEHQAGALDRLRRAAQRPGLTQLIARP